jgi:hypothetical protein
MPLRWSSTQCFSQAIPNFEPWKNSSRSNGFRKPERLIAGERRSE